MSAKWLRLWSCVLVLAFPVSLMASDAVGLLTSSGTVLVDGSPSVSGTAIFSGEQIRTGNSARAILSTRAMSFALAPNSSVRVAPASLEIASGAVVVTGSDAVLRVNGTRIATETNGKFIVQRDQDNLKIVALTGALVVGEGQQQTTVPATTGVNIGKSKKGGENPQDAGNPVPKTNNWLSNPDIGILVVVAAAVAAGVSLGIVNSRNSSASPSVP